MRQRVMEMAARFGEMEFNLDWEEGDNKVENLRTFQYLGRPLYQRNYDWTAVLQNIMRSGSVWGRLG